MVQYTYYHPYGKPIGGESGGQEAQPYKYNGAEQETMMGMTRYDLGNRSSDYAYNDMPTQDRFAEKFPWQSPYIHAGGNPIRFVDVRGDSTNISGTEQQAAFQQAQARVSNELTLTMNSNGTLTAVQISKETLSNNAQQLMDAINSGTIQVNIVTTNGTTDGNGNLIVGGGFGGNVVTQTSTGNTVVATQTINPNVLSTMSNASGNPGQDVLHEITEAYQGALISQQSGVSSPASNQSGSVYPQAHNQATPQSGVVTETAYGMYGMPMTRLPNGNFTFPPTRVEWSVTNTSGQKIIMQRFP